MASSLPSGGILCGWAQAATAGTKMSTASVNAPNVQGGRGTSATGQVDSRGQQYPKW
jgi:hypothetical protein